MAVSWTGSNDNSVYQRLQRREQAKQLTAAGQFSVCALTTSYAISSGLLTIPRESTEEAPDKPGGRRTGHDLRACQFVGHRTAVRHHITPGDDRGGLRQVPAFLHCRLRLMLQKNPETKSVRNQEQRHDQSWKKECGSQLPGQKSGVIPLVENI